MRFNIKEIGNDGLVLDLPVTAAWLAEECPNLDARWSEGGLVVQGKIEESGDDFLLRGRVHGALIMTCARCLEDADVPLDIPLVVTFVDEAKASDADDDDDDGGDIVALDDGEMDVGAEVRDQILLAVPMKPLCREDCLGLCSTCGGNLNLLPCGCQKRERPVASALDALSRIKLTD